MIPLVLLTALGKGNEVGVFGDDYPTPDGTCIRDYIHVDDLADAHIKALNYLKQEQKSLRVNLGTGKGNSVKEIIEKYDIHEVIIAIEMSERKEIGNIINKKKNFKIYFYL